MSEQDQPPSPPPVPVPEKKKGMSAGCVVAVVLGIVALVILIVLPLAIVAGRHILAKAHPPSAGSQMKGLEVAIKGYQTEYNRFPSAQSPPPFEDNSQGYNTTAAEGQQILKILMATDTTKNPRQIRYFNPPEARKAGGGYTPEGGLVDIWGTNGYMMIFDYNGDGVIADPEHPGAKLSYSVLIYSAGADGNFSTWDDNITSWDRK